MRIIAGTFKGIVLPSPKDKIVKPTLDRIKENIFNILQFKVEGSVCLDLFCGSGALGIECLSRKAKEVYFVDSNKNNTKALGDFLNKLKVKNAFVQTGDYYDLLKKFSLENKKFDIIFLDPPFEENLAEVALSKIFKFKLLSADGVVVWEHPTNIENIKYKQKVTDSRRYGKIQIDFLK